MKSNKCFEHCSVIDIIWLLNISRCQPSPGNWIGQGKWNSTGAGGEEAQFWWLNLPLMNVHQEEAEVFSTKLYTGHETTISDGRTDFHLIFTQTAARAARVTIGAITWNQPGRDDLPQQWPWSLHDYWRMLPTIPRLWFHKWSIFRCLQKSADLVMLFWWVSKLQAPYVQLFPGLAGWQGLGKWSAGWSGKRNADHVVPRAICVLELRYMSRGWLGSKNSRIASHKLQTSSQRICRQNAGREAFELYSLIVRLNLNDPSHISYLQQQFAQFHCEVMKKPATKKSLEVKDPMFHLGDQHPTVLEELFLSLSCETSTLLDRKWGWYFVIYDDVYLYIYIYMIDICICFFFFHMYICIYICIYTLYIYTCIFVHTYIYTERMCIDILLTWGVYRSRVQRSCFVIDFLPLFDLRDLEKPFRSFEMLASNKFWSLVPLSHVHDVGNYCPTLVGGCRRRCGDGSWDLSKKSVCQDTFSQWSS